MVRKSISVTSQQNDWIKAQMEAGHYGNESEVLRELIRERQLRELENQGDIERIRAKIMKAEKSGFSEKSAAELLAEIKGEMLINE